MTLKVIKQNHKLVRQLGQSPNNLRFCNAYIDQALMNFSYESMNAKEQNEALELIAAMIEKFNKIRGR